MFDESSGSPVKDVVHGFASRARPSSEPNARTFPETGKRLGGLFRIYWESHGGLAQQGYPISDEFDEVSEPDGKTYRVQYFERAVFEYHPENQPPYNVLLSQLGTFRHREKYGALSAQLSGSSNQIAPFALKAGLAVFQSVRAANDGYFYIDVVDSAGNHLATIASGSIPLDLSKQRQRTADFRRQVNGACIAWRNHTFHLRDAHTSV